MNRAVPSRQRKKPLSETLTDDPLWYKDAVIYELHVRAFHDADGDGIGDFKGLIQKLDYLQDLGVTAIWLLPFFPSPLKDDGYDIGDYTNVNSSYGTLRDFKRFLRETHARGMRVIIELVINHTSDQHPWFQRARRAKAGTKTRDFYVWNDNDRKYHGTRIIFQDFETSNWTWDPVAKAYYWHRFYHHQPDLNFENPAVRKAVFQVLDFWLSMGVDGLRLDAVPYLYEEEGTNCENLPRTHAFLKELRAYVDARYDNRMLLAEANMWPEDAAAYFGDGDECHMNFHFPLMPRLFMAVRMEDRFPLIDILRQTPEIAANCQWALFLRNHDELTLEMVTDQERDYMYRVYAEDPRARINLGIRRRLAPLLGNDRKKIELLNSLLFSLPGTPVLYYGDEIGMGDNIFLGDRNGVRTPMQWSNDRNAGFSRANPQSLFLPVIIDPENHFETTNVETQQKNPHSLLWFMKRLIALRNRHKAFGRGTLEFLLPDNAKVLTFLRRTEDETILVVVNLSRYVQPVELDLAGFAGRTPIELFGRAVLPPIEEGRPYFLTLGPHSFYWLDLPEPKPRGVEEGPAAGAAPLPLLRVKKTWDEAFLDPKRRARLADAFPGHLRARRWFAGKTQTIRSTEVREAIPLPGKGQKAFLLLVRVEYLDRDPETYQVPVTWATGERAASVRAQWPSAAIATLRRGDGQEALLYDALVEPAHLSGLLDFVAKRRNAKGEVAGRLVAHSSKTLRRRLADAEGLEPRVLGVEQSNTSVVFGQAVILKLFRTVHPGVNPDLEIGRFLTQTGFPHTAHVAGHLEYQYGKDQLMTLGILHEFVPNQGDAWTFTQERLASFYERVLMRSEDPPDLSRKRLLDFLDVEVEADPTHDPEVEDLVGIYLPMARLLGERVAELHNALASRTDPPEFRPEGFPPHAQKQLYQQLRSATLRSFGLLRKQLGSLPEELRPEAEATLAIRDQLLEQIKTFRDLHLTAERIRPHGDLHLGQILYTGKDFVIIDFEGEPARSLTERRLKRSALRDVAGMIRSFHYAAFAGLHADALRPEDRERVRPWVGYWYHWVSMAFLEAYLRTAGRAPFLPEGREELELLLDYHLLEKALYELAYELDNRPDWVTLPLQGILQSLHSE